MARSAPVSGRKIKAQSPRRPSRGKTWQACSSPGRGVSAPIGYAIDCNLPPLPGLANDCRVFFPPVCAAADRSDSLSAAAAGRAPESTVHLPPLRRWSSASNDASPHPCCCCLTFDHPPVATLVCVHVERLCSTLGSITRGVRAGKMGSPDGYTEPTSCDGLGFFVREGSSQNRSSRNLIG